MQKKNSIIKNFLVLLSGSGLNILVGVVTTPIITRIIAPTEYGQLSFFNLYSNFIYVVLMLGFDQALVRYYYEKKEERKNSQLLFNLIKFPMLISFICGIILFFQKDKLNLFGKSSTLIILLFIFNIITLILFRFSMLVLRLEMDTKLYAFLNVLHKILYVFIVVILVKFLKGFYFEILAFATVFSVLIPTLIAIWKKRKIWNFTSNDRRKIEDFQKIFKYSFPFIFSSIISWGFEAIDKLSIKNWGTYRDVGVYSAAVNITGLFSIIGTTFTTLWIPIAMEHYTKNPHDNTIYNKVNAGITIAMYYMGLIIILFKEIFVLFLGSDYRGTEFILPCLMFNPIMFAISETTVNGINFKEKSYFHIIVTTVALIVNFCGNHFLVPKYGSTGAAISTGFAYIVFFYMRTIISRKLYYVDYNLPKFTILTIIFYLYAIYSCFHSTNLYSVLIFLILAVSIFVFYKEIHIEAYKFLKSKMRRNKKCL